MPVFKRKPNTGSHYFVLNGKRIRIRPLDEIECEPEDLGAFQDKYELISAGKRKKDSRSPMEVEVIRYESLLRPKSWILNPEWSAPHGSFVYTPSSTDRQGQQKLLADLEARLALAEDDLTAVREEWRAQVEADPMRELTEDNPKGDWFYKIAQRTAQRNHVRAEASEIKRRLQALEPIVDAEIREFRHRRQLRGFLRKHEGRYIEVDGFTVEYNVQDKPIIPELGCSLLEYLDKVKAHKRIGKEIATSKRTRTEAARS